MEMQIFFKFFFFFASGGTLGKLINSQQGTAFWGRKSFENQNNELKDAKTKIGSVQSWWEFSVRPLQWAEPLIVVILFSY